MKNRKLAMILTSALAACTVFAGCGSSSSSSSAAADSASETSSAAESSSSEASSSAETSSSTETSSSDTTATEDLSGTVSTDGSTSMEKVITMLGEAFQEKYPNVTVSYNPTGSSSGITAAKEGSCDLGLASRDLKDDEKDGLEATTIALDGICVIVNNENTVEDLSLDQIKSIYTGETTNWKDVGGSDGEIVCIGREAGSGTRDGFESITDTKDSCKLSQELTSTGDVIQTVANNPNAIGYASLAAVEDTVKSLTVDGVAPSEETVQDGTYKIQRNFNVIVNTSQDLSPQAQAFYDYITSSEADELIAKAGAVPLAK